MTISHTEELLQADYSRIEYAHVRFKRGDEGERKYVEGRIVDRWNDADLRLRYDGHEYDVTIQEAWELVRCKTVSAIEKRMIESEWNDD